MKDDKKNNHDEDQADESVESLTDDVIKDDQVSDQGVNDDFAKLQKEFNELKEQFENLQNQLRRAVADYQNLEKRVAEGRAELSTWATGELIQRILPVLDNLEKAVLGVSEDEKKSGWVKGVEMSIKQLQDVLKSEGLDEIRADGQFEPALHEAVDTREGKGNQVLEVVEKGYNLNGKYFDQQKWSWDENQTIILKSLNMDEGSNKQS